MSEPKRPSHIVPASTPPSPAKNPVRILVHGEPADATWLETLAAQTPVEATIVLAGTATSVDARFTLVAGTDSVVELLDTARRAWPGEHLVLMQANVALPPLWYERLLDALDDDSVLVASPLDNNNSSRSPLPTGVHSDADPERIDRLCCAYGRRVAYDHDDFSALTSAWHGARLREANLSAPVSPLDIAPFRGVLLDHLYVAKSDRPLSGPAPVALGAEPPPPSPLGELRAGVATALAANVFPSVRHGIEPKPVLLHILHGWGGGAARFVRDFATADTAHAHLVLIARGHTSRKCYGEILELHDGASNGPPLRRLVLPAPIADTAAAHRDYRDFLTAVVCDYGVAAVMISSLIGHSLDAMRTGLPTLIVAHDVYPLWPLLHRDFGDTALPFDAVQLAADLAGNTDGEFGNRNPTHWQRLREAYVEAVIAANATIIAPSHTALENLLRLGPPLDTLPQRVIAHGLAEWATPHHTPAPPARPRLRLVVLGRVRRGKGAKLLRAALPALRKHAELFLLGAGADAEAFFGERDVHVLLDYHRDELPMLIGKIAPDAALLLPTVAETFSYTLSECISLGIPVVATRVGALAERIVDGETGFLAMPSAEAIVARVALLAQNRAVLARVRERLTQATPRDLTAMVADYAPLLPQAPLPANPGSPTPAIINAVVCGGEIHSLARQLAALHEKVAQQQRMLDTRANWGIGLEKDLKRSRRRLDELGAELDERTHWARALDIEVTANREEIARLGMLARERDELLQSTSWRATAPLRALMQHWRALRALLAFRRQRLYSTWQRTRGSLARRGLVGTLRRIRHELVGAVPAVMPIAQPPTENFAPFAVPRAELPHVSIVIPVYNKIAYTAACLRSLVEHTGNVAFETIVIDDSSTDATQEHLAQIDGVHVIRNTQNLGFIGSCNAGAAAARGEFVLFLNNDTVVTQGWLEALLSCFDEEAETGLVGAKLIYPDGRLQEAGGIVFRDGSGWNYGRFDDPTDPRYEFKREADYVSGAAILIRRELFKKLGGFDERYAPAYYEDTDLAFAVRAAGFKVFYEPRAVVIHFEGITAGTDIGSGTKRYQAINREKFLEKWKNVLATQPAPIDDVRTAPIAATHRARRRILIIDACTPMPDQDSGSLRMMNLIRLLRTDGWQVTFFADNRLRVDRYTAAVQMLGVEVQYLPWLSDPVAFFRERGTEFNAVLLSRHYVAVNYVGLVRLYAPQAKLVFDTVDLHYLREERAAALADSAELGRQATVTRAQEQKLIRESDVTLVVSPVEQILLAQHLPKARVEILSNVHEVYGCRRPFAERRDLVFVGSFQHPPNVDAVLWFAREILSRVRAELTDVRLHVIGKPVPTEIAALAGDALVVHGYVEDLEPFMDGCRVSVAPLRYGAGVKGKVNMAMSYGLPVVATPVAVEGMQLDTDADVLVAATPPAFAAAIMKLYRDPLLWQQLSRNGLANVKQHFSFAAAQVAMRRVFD